jgi:hypothetical protein
MNIDHNKLQKDYKNMEEILLKQQWRWRSS